MSLRGVYEVQYRTEYAGAITTRTANVVGADAEDALGVCKARLADGVRWVGLLRIRPLALED